MIVCRPLVQRNMYSCIILWPVAIHVGTLTVNSMHHSQLWPSHAYPITDMLRVFDRVVDVIYT